jgi:hypothetical protein
MDYRQRASNNRLSTKETFYVKALDYRLLFFSSRQGHEEIERPHSIHFNYIGGTTPKIYKSSAPHIWVGCSLFLHQTGTYSCVLKVK